MNGLPFIINPVSGKLVTLALKKCIQGLKSNADVRSCCSSIFKYGYHKLKEIANSTGQLTVSNFHAQWHLDWKQETMVRQLTCNYVIFLFNKFSLITVFYLRKQTMMLRSSIQNEMYFNSM